MKIKTICKGIVFVLGFLLIFLTVQEILTPEWNKDGNTEKIIGGLYALEEDTIDVLFLGNSTVSRGISPMELYESTNIRSYNLATSGQPIQGSYFLLKECFQTQHPKYVFLDISRMFARSDDLMNAYYRYIIDNLKMGPVRLEMARAYEEVEGNDGFLSGIFPIIKYHSRWNELTKEDFRLNIFPDVYEMMGQAYYPYYTNATFSLDMVEQLWAEEQAKSVSGVQMIQTNGAIEELPVTYSPVTYEIDPVFIQYFDKIQQLCEVNGATLVTLKIPVHFYSTIVGWNKARSRIASDYIADCGVDFLDLMYPGIVNPETDFHDDGGHLNPRGVAVVTSAIGTYLMERMDISLLESDPFFDSCLAKYAEVRDYAQIGYATNLKDYLRILHQNSWRWTIYISSYDEYTANLDEEARDLFSQLGLELIRQSNYRDGYAAIINQGTVEYEALSHFGVNCSTTVNGNNVYIAGCGGDYPDVGSAITVSGKDYSLHKRGLNIVVWDAVTNKWLHTAAFDTYSGITRTGVSQLNIPIAYDFYVN